jgi:hypothetical protein
VGPRNLNFMVYSLVTLVSSAQSFKDLIDEIMWMNNVDESGMDEKYMNEK